MMRILVLGAGLQGAACAYDLLRTTDHEVTLADLHEVVPPAFLREWDGGRLEQIQLDIRDRDATRAVMQRHAGAVSALPYYFNADAARLAVEAGIHFADLGGNTDIVREQETLERQAVEAGVSVIPDCGLAPGMVNILARDGIGRLDTARSVRLYVGGLPQHPEPPLNYQVVYSLEGALDYYTTRSWVLRGGRPVQVEALTELEALAFDSLGTLEAFHTAGGLSTMPWDYEDADIQVMEYKTLRYPGHAHIMKAIRDVGLLDTGPVDVKGVSVVPRDEFIAVVGPKLRKPDGHDLVALRVVVEGTRGGQDTTVTYNLLDRYDAEHGISAMMRTTAFSLSITAQMQQEGRMGPPGVRTAYQATPGAEYMKALAERGIVINVEETS